VNNKRKSMIYKNEKTPELGVFDISEGVFMTILWSRRVS
jgi:hypothetical protein